MGKKTPALQWKQKLNVWGREEPTAPNTTPYPNMTLPPLKFSLKS